MQATLWLGAYRMFRGSLGSAPREPARHAGLRAGSVLGRLGLGALVLGRAFGALLGRGLLAHHGGGHDGRDGEIAFGDGRMHAFRQLHRGDVHAVADLPAGQIDLDVLRNGVTPAGTLHLASPAVAYGPALEARTTT